MIDVRAQATTGDRHDELYAKARQAVDVAANEGFIDMGDFSGVDERGEVLAWLDAAADALRLQYLGQGDRQLLAFVQRERDESMAKLERLHLMLEEMDV